MASQSLVSSSIDRSSRPALKNKVSLASKSSSTTIGSSGLSEKGGTEPMTQPVSSCAVSGEAKPHLRASNKVATALKSSLRLPASTASTWRRPPPPPRRSSTIALAAWSGRLPRMTLIAFERPSASCSMMRNFALASLSSATNRSNMSAATDDLVRQKLQGIAEARHLAVGRRDGSVHSAAKASLGCPGHQRVDAGLAQGPGDQPHLFPAPAGMHGMGLGERGDEIAEVHQVGVAEATQHFLEDALALGSDQRFDGQRLDALHQHASYHLHRRGAARPRPQHLDGKAVAVHPRNHRLNVGARRQHRRLDTVLEEAAHHGDV